MSHFTKSRIKVKMSCKDSLLKALARMGFNVEVGEKLTVLNSFSQRSGLVEIKISSDQFNYSLDSIHDVGFFQEDGEYFLLADFWAFAMSQSCPDFVKELNFQYQKVVVEKTIQRLETEYGFHTTYSIIQHEDESVEAIIDMPDVVTLSY